MNTKNKASMLNMKRITSLSVNVWNKVHMLLFFSLLLCAIGLGGYVWQRNVSGSNWSEEKKQEYLNMQSAKIIFKEKDFKKAMDDIQMRKRKNPNGYRPIKDIFMPY